VSSIKRQFFAYSSSALSIWLSGHLKCKINFITYLGILWNSVNGGSALGLHLFKKTQKYILAPSGTRNYDPSVQVIKTSGCFGPRVHCDWSYCCTLVAFEQLMEE
jgi:hypothetical protein